MSELRKLKSGVQKVKCARSHDLVLGIFLIKNCAVEK